MNVSAFFKKNNHSVTPSAKHISDSLKNIVMRIKRNEDMKFCKTHDDKQLLTVEKLKVGEQYEQYNEHNVQLLLQTILQYQQVLYKIRIKHDHHFIGFGLFQSDVHRYVRHKLLACEAMLDLIQNPVMQLPPCRKPAVTNGRLKVLYSALIKLRDPQLSSALKKTAHGF